MINFIKKNKAIIITIIMIFITVIIIDKILNISLLGSSVYNSYELQARAWLNGSVYLDHDYSFLELAIYNNNYYVSFPPLPSVILLPFVFIFKDNIPTNLIMLIIFTIQVIVIYKILKRYKNNEFTSILLALGLTIGSNLMALVIDSGVWFVAQIINNCLCILAIDAFLKDKKSLVYFYLALAVGCRPFSAIYMVMFFVYYMIKDKDNFLKRLLNNIKPLLPAIIIAIIYMAYNYIRFNNPLEFGHNYLPEFVRSQDGQFSFNYLLPNLKQLLFNRIYFVDWFKLDYQMPFCFLIANPLFIVYVYHSVKNLFITKKFNLLRLLIFVALSLNIIAICLHKTLGGWQFGARYTCDLLPFVFLALITFDDKKNTQVKLDILEIVCIILGIILNIYGAISYYSS